MEGKPYTRCVGDWTLDPVQLTGVALVAIAYGVRARTLARQRRPVAAWRIGLFALGLVLLAAALFSPISALAEERLTAHMVQHLLIGDLAPLALLAGLTGPLLRPVLALPPARALRVLMHPAVTLPLWAANLYLWHIPGAYEAAITNDLVHAVQHVSFLTAGILVWAPVLEVVPAPAWFGTAAKLGYVVGVRLTAALLANVFFWAPEVFYDPYAAAGVSDQAVAGGAMMVEGSLVTVGAFAWLFLRLFAEGETKQRLIEQGVNPQAVDRAVRYGRADQLS